MIKDIFRLQNGWIDNPNYEFPAFERDIETILDSQLKSKLIIGLIGSRQVGKSSIIYRTIKKLLNTGIPNSDIFYFNLDDLKLHELFTDITQFVQFAGRNIDGKDSRKYIFIDEIQRLENPGLFLKELYDLKLNYKIFYSGSSQLELKSKLKENLVGRARVFEIKRLSFSELLTFASPITNREALEHVLIFGNYPGVCIEKSNMEKKLLIKDIYQSYIQKDITDFLKINNYQVFNNLLIALAAQSGSLLSIDNLSKSLKTSRRDIEHFINVLEGTFIIKRIYPFFRNYKKEITKTPKAYFLDNGLRNFILNSFNSLNIRNDIGSLFESFIFTEIDKLDFHSIQKINYWRTTNQTEIDFIVQNDFGNFAVEVKWEKNIFPKSFTTFKKYYPKTKCLIINKNNFSSMNLKNAVKIKKALN